MRYQLEFVIEEEERFWRTLALVRESNLKNWPDLTPEQVFVQMMKLNGQRFNPKLLKARLYELNGGNPNEQVGDEWKAARVLASVITMGNISMPGPGSLNAVAAAVKKALDEVSVNQKDLDGLREIIKGMHRTGTYTIRSGTIEHQAVVSILGPQGCLTAKRRA